MSADNGIYVAKFPDGYRVTGDVQAIENVDYYPVGSEERKRMLKRYFGKSKIYATDEEALKVARKLEYKILNDPNNDFPYLEYGVCYLGEYESFEEDQDKFLMVFKEKSKHTTFEDLYKFISDLLFKGDRCLTSEDVNSERLTDFILDNYNDIKDIIERK